MEEDKKQTNKSGAIDLDLDYVIHVFCVFFPSLFCVPE